MNYTEISTNMVAFCRLLRGEGMMLGSTEQTDALHALRLIDVADRGQFRQALRTVLAKGHAEQVTRNRQPDTGRAVDAAGCRPERWTAVASAAAQAGSVRRRG
jgi:hypothetical protein